jgi:hypothetical protein
MVMIFENKMEDFGEMEDSISGVYSVKWKFKLVIKLKEDVYQSSTCASKS